MDGDTISVERTIAAPAADIFALLSDATRHHVFDGSGAVRDAPEGTEPLREGSVFGMSMKQGFSYSTKNTVIEFQPDRRIAWQTTGSGLLASVVGGRIWRYELEPTGDDSTLVRETWDISQDKQGFLLKRTSMPGATRTNMEKTLSRLDAELTGS